MPEEDLNRGLTCEGKLVGDCPNVSALDANLNKDIHDVVHWHVSITRRSTDTDLQKSSIMRQKKGASAYMCMWDPCPQEEDVEAGVPSSSHIIEDMMHRHNETYIHIYLHHGVALEGLVGK
eukprot:3128646-Ditylum_brightwellii.AAC.1